MKNAAKCVEVQKGVRRKQVLHIGVMSSCERSNEGKSKMNNSGLHVQGPSPNFADH
jgi:hypothetical protein